MRSLRLPFVVVASVALALAGCVSKPTMKLNHAEIQGVQFGFPLQIGVQMRVVLEVYNPNSYDVAVRAVRGQTVLAEKYALPVDFRAEGNGLWMPAKQTTMVAVPVNVPVQTGIAILGEAISANAVAYHFTGKADVTGTRTFQIEEDDYSVDERGQVPRQQFEAAIRSLPIPQLPHW